MRRRWKREGEQREGRKETGDKRQEIGMCKGEVGRKEKGEEGEKREKKEGRWERRIGRRECM